MIISRISRYSKIPLNCYLIGKEKDSISSNLIIDPMMFQSSSLADKLINKFKTSQSLFDCRRSFKSFSADKFCAQYLIKYNEFVNQYEKKGTIIAEQILSQDLFKKYKGAKKSNDVLPFHLEKANKLQIVQVRTITNQLSLFKMVDQWFQFTCKFTPQNGTDCFYHVLQRNSKGKLFKIVKLDLH